MLELVHGYIHDTEYWHTQDVGKTLRQWLKEFICKNSER